MRFITDTEAASAIDHDRLTADLESALTDLAAGRAASTVRVRAAADGALVSALAATWPPGRISGGKVYATTGGVFSFVTVLFDLDGHPLAVIDGDALTRARTPATTAVAIRALAPARPSVVAVIGTGRQCAGHLDMLARECDHLEQVRVVGRTVTSRDTAITHARSLGLPVVVASDPAAAVKDADLVLTLTSSRDALFPASALTRPVLVAALGSTKRDRVEIGADVVAAATRIITDDPEGAPTECGDLIAAADAGVLDWARVEDLATVVASSASPLAGAPAAGRSEGQVVLYESQGTALQDVVAAAHVLGTSRR